MKERSEKELRQAMEHGETFAVLFHTPTCGTCKAALRMLQAVELLLPDLPFYTCNLNVAPRLAEELQIRSVPCAGLVRKGLAAALRYRMGGADELYRFYISEHTNGSNRED